MLFLAYSVDSAATSTSIIRELAAVMYSVLTVRVSDA